VEEIWANSSWDMTFEITEIIKSKHAYRALLAARPLAEDLLRALDCLVGAEVPRSAYRG
jgi:hypothetical protein